eukprot:1288196-Amphidinium_carterae.1
MPTPWSVEFHEPGCGVATVNQAVKVLTSEQHNLTIITGSPLELASSKCEGKQTAKSTHAGQTCTATTVALELTWQCEEVPAPEANTCVYASH